MARLRVTGVPRSLPPEGPDEEGPMEGGDTRCASGTCPGPEVSEGLRVSG